jgi:predicted HTH transcriptional regulator
VLDQGRNRQHVLTLWNALDKLLMRPQPASFRLTTAPYGSRPASELATLPEDKFLEHKHAFAFRVSDNSRDTRLSDKILDRICGFWNTEGGTVLVGVEDRTGRIVGLDGDVKLFKDLDGLVNHVSSKVHQEMAAIAPFIDIKIELACDKPVLRIDVPAGDAEVFRQDRFYVRENNTTRELRGEPLLKYLQSRWPRV